MTAGRRAMMPCNRDSDRMEVPRSATRCHSTSEKRLVSNWRTRRRTEGLRKQSGCVPKRHCAASRTWARRAGMKRIGHPMPARKLRPATGNQRDPRGSAPPTSRGGSSPEIRADPGNRSARTQDDRKNRPATRMTRCKGRPDGARSPAGFMMDAETGHRTPFQRPSSHRDNRSDEEGQEPSMPRGGLIGSPSERAAGPSRPWDWAP